MSSFGDELRRRRLAARLSYDGLADLAGISKTYLVNIEKDTPHNVTGKPPRPTRETVDRLATALGWDVFSARTLAFVGRPDSQADDAEPQLDDIHALQGRVLHKLPTGTARERYLAKLRASVESDLEMIEARLNAQDEQ
jgi:transcriptional regulator with XRE-family HTH domain